MIEQISAPDPPENKFCEECKYSRICNDMMAYPGNCRDFEQKT